MQGSRESPQNCAVLAPFTSGYDTTCQVLEKVVQHAVWSEPVSAGYPAYQATNRENLEKQVPEQGVWAG